MRATRGALAVPCDDAGRRMSSDDDDRRRDAAGRAPETNNGTRLSWHEHVYRKVSGRPTPHYIENILGLHQEGKEPTATTAANAATTIRAPAATAVEMNEPLNLSIKSDLKVRPKTVKGGWFAEVGR